MVVPVEDLEGRSRGIVDPVKRYHPKLHEKAVYRYYYAASASAFFAIQTTRLREPGRGKFRRHLDRTDAMFFTVPC